MSLCLEMKFVLFFFFAIFCLHSSYANEIEDEWSNFKIKFGKNYTTEEENNEKFEIFKENFEFIQKHNSEGGKTFKVEVNRFADLENSDFGSSDSFEPG